MDGNLSRSIVEDMTSLLPSDRFTVVRWVPTLVRAVPITYRVMVDVMRFDSYVGDSVFLEANWTVFGKERDILLARKSSISRKVNGTEFTDLVTTMSGVVEDLSREISAGVISLEQKPQGK